MPTTAKRGDALIELFLSMYGAGSWAGDLSRREYPERVKDGGVETIATQVTTGRTLAIEHTVHHACGPRRFARRKLSTSLAR